MIHRIEVIMAENKQPEITEHYSVHLVAYERFMQLVKQYGLQDTLICEEANNNCYAGGYPHAVLICLESLIDNLNDYE